MKLRAAGATVHQFEGGEPYMHTPDFVKEAMKRAVDENRSRYAPSSGIPELREAIAAKLQRKNGIPAQQSEVVVMNGGMQGLFGGFQSVVHPTDERSEEHTSELQSRLHLVCRLLLEKK